VLLRNIGKPLTDYYTALSLFTDSNVQPGNLSFYSGCFPQRSTTNLQNGFVTCFCGMCIKGGLFTRKNAAHASPMLQSPKGQLTEKSKPLKSSQSVVGH
jgi:hypothetical protein